MSNVERRITGPASYEEVLDEYADKLGSYDEARRAIGPSPYEEKNPDVETFALPRAALGVKAAEATVKVNRSSRGPRGEEEGMGYKDGKPHYFRPVGEVFDLWKDPEQQAINQNNSAKLRAKMGWSSDKENEPTKTASSH